MKNKKLIYIILTIYITIVSITTLVLLFKSYQSKELKKAYFTTIEKNYSRKFINSIKIQISPCSNPKKNLLNLEFPGTENYCHCTNGINYEDSCKFSEYRSFYNFFGPSCKNILKVKPYSIKKINKIYFCAEFSDLSYSKIKNVNPEKKNCEKNFKICGKDTKDFLCFPSKLECPINDIIISNSEKQNLKSQNYKEQKIQNFYIYTTNKKTKNNLLVDFKIGHKNICISPEEEIAPIKQFAYLSKKFDLECESDLNGKFIDERYKLIFEMDKYELYKQNGFLTFLKNLPGFSSYSLKYNLSLFSAPFFHFSNLCFEKFEDFGFLSKIDVIRYLFSEKESYFKFFVVFGIVIFFLVLAGMVFLTCFAIMAREVKIRFLWVLGIFVFFVFVVFCFVLYLFFDDKKKFDFLGFLGNNCGDFFVNDIVLEKKEILKELRDFYIVMISLFFSVFFFLGFLFL